MRTIEGGLGEGKLLVFQPATPPKAGLDIALGVQRFWQKALVQAGRAASCTILMGKVERVTVQGTLEGEPPLSVGDKLVIGVDAWRDAQVVETVRRFECRFALVSTLSATPERARLSTRLLEVDADGLRPLGDVHELDAGWAAVPLHVWDVLVDVARRVGATLPYARAEEAFDTPDAAAAIAILQATGLLSMAEEGCRLELSPVFDELARVVETAGPARPVVALVPELLDHLGRLGAHDLQLAGFLRRARQSLGTLPPQWTDLLDRLAAARQAN